MAAHLPPLLWSLAACFLLPASLSQACLAQAQEPVEKLRDLHAEAEARGDFASAARLMDRWLAERPNDAQAWYLRGRDRFRCGRFGDAVQDFDQHIQRSPELSSRQWERGIAQYYAGDFAGGAKQFEEYQTYHANDVENSVWRFLCVARHEGLAAARRCNLLPIRDDRRLGMMQIFELYQGRITPQDMLRFLSAQGKATAIERAAAWFYADLYLGLYFEVTGDLARANYHIQLAATPAVRDNPRVNRYMWEVARLHAEQFKSRVDSQSDDLGMDPALTGWTVMGKREGWQLNDGILRSEGGRGGEWLRSEQAFDDFVMEVDWRVSKDGNSGVFLRSQAEGAPWTSGYEVQISNAPRDDSHCTGSLYGYAAADPRPAETADTWHRFVILCDGPMIRVTCDGVTCVCLNQSDNQETRDKPLRGHVGLQDAHASAGHYVEFRNVKVSKLPAKRG